MHAIVLAGGYATRLWPITKNRPKMLLPVGDQTVIGTVFDPLERDERINDVYVSTNEKFADEFAAYIEESRYDKPQLSIEDTTQEAEKFGVVGALAQLVERENLSENTLVIAGDNVISFDLSDFVDAFQANDIPRLAAYDVGSYERASEYGLLELDGAGRVTDFQEKPDDPNSTLVSVACYGFPSGTLPKLDAYLAGDNNPDEPGWFIQWLQKRQTVHAYTFKEAWFDIGTPGSYLDAVAWRLDGSNHVHPDAVVEGATLGENVHIMSDVELRDVTIDNSVVFPGATIEGGEIRRSIIDCHTHIKSLNLSDTVIGPHAHVNGQSRKMIGRS